jgi:hypothetical protein
MQKIIFLDIDGVLNNDLVFDRAELMYVEDFKKNYYLNLLDFTCVDYLSQLSIETSAKTVITSTWRKHLSIAQLRDIFKLANFKGEIVGTTPILDSEEYTRGHEIEKWLKFNEGYFGVNPLNYKNYVILDDDTDMLYWQKDNFIPIDNKVGLTLEDIAKAKLILNQ